MRKPALIGLSVCLVILLGAGCSASREPAQTGKKPVTVSILPEKYFVEQIGGDRVTVNVMVGPGDSPHTYEPKPEQMAAISQSKIYFAIGVEFESAWLDKIASASPAMKIVDLSAGIEKIPMSAYLVATGGEEHAAGEMDPHIWTSPENVKIIARSIAAELAGIDKPNEKFYQSNLDAFLSDIERLQADITGMLDNLDSRRFLVFHPAWGYFAREFDLEEIPIEEGGTEPSASELGAIIDVARNENIRVVFAQPEFSAQIAKYIASEIDGQVTLISPLAENWLENLRLVAKAFEDNL